MCNLIKCYKKFLIFFCFFSRFYCVGFNYINGYLFLIFFNIIILIIIEIKNLSYLNDICFWLNNEYVKIIEYYIFYILIVFDWIICVSVVVSVINRGGFGIVC